MLLIPFYIRWDCDFSQRTALHHLQRAKGEKSAKDANTLAKCDLKRASNQSISFHSERLRECVCSAMLTH